MRRITFVTSLLLLAGCGGSSAASGAGSTPAPSHPDPSTWREDLQCHDADPSGAIACAREGCEWRAPYHCSGIEEPYDEAIDRSAVCVCVCERDLVDCMSQP